MNLRLYLLSFLLNLPIITTYLKAQCGVSQQDQVLMKETMMHNREMARIHNQESPQGIRNIPIRLVLLSKSDGSEKVKPMSDLLNIPCKLNNCLKNISLEFFIKDIDTTLRNDSLFFNKSWIFEPILRKYVLQNKDAINIFISNGSIGGSILSYTNFTDDYIVYTDLKFVTSQEFLCHEIGHFFSLPHTYAGGMDFLPYDCKNPQFTKYAEYVNREHLDSLGRKSCLYLGDGFCDTQADYADDNSFPITCFYNGCAVDPDGDSLITDKENYMSLFLNTTSCSLHYAKDQEQAMLNDFELSSSRKYLHTNYSPITTLPRINYISPLNNEKLIGSTNILLNWDDIPNVTLYLVEYTIVSFNSTYKVEVITSTSELLISSLDPNRKYLWRVTPIAYPATCSYNSISQSFQTGALINTKDLNNYKDFSLYINPTTNELFIKNYYGKLQYIKAYKMYSIIGELVDHSNILSTSINLNQYSSSTYILNWLDEDNNWQVGRFIKY